MPLTLVTPPSGYPVTLDEVRAWCRIHAGNQERAPDAPTVALAGAGAGNVDNGAHRYLVVFVTAAGKTNAGTPSSVVTIVDKTIDGKVALSGIQIGSTAVTAREIYRAAGAGAYLLVATIADNTTTVYTDNIADASLGAGAPTANTTDDPVLNMLAGSATRRAETITRCALLTQTWDLTLDRFPAWVLNVPKPPLRSVTSITYIDTNGVTQTLDASQYVVDTKSEPGRITPAFGAVWPSTQCRINAVTVRLVCGFGAAADVPADVKHWIQLRLSTMEINRESLFTDAAQVLELPAHYVDGLLDSVSDRSFTWANDYA